MGNKITLVDDIFPIVLLFGFIVGIRKYKNLSKEIKIFIWYLLISFIISGFGIILRHRGISNIGLLHLYTIIEYCILIYILSSWLNDPLKKILRISIPFFIFISLLFKFIFESIVEFDNTSVSLETIILIIISFIILYRLNQIKTDDIVKDYRFWICSGILIYFMSSIIFFINVNSIMKLSLSSGKIAWAINHVVFIIANILFTIGILLNQKNDLHSFKKD